MAEPRTRAHRRVYDRLAKLRTIRKMKQWNATRNMYSSVLQDPGYIGKNAAVHCRGCSCFCCQNHKDIAPERERMFMDTLSESD